MANTNLVALKGYFDNDAVKRYVDSIEEDNKDNNDE